MEKKSKGHEKAPAMHLTQGRLLLVSGPLCLVHCPRLPYVPCRPSGDFEVWASRPAVTTRIWGVFIEFFDQLAAIYVQEIDYWGYKVIYSIITSTKNENVKCKC